MIDKKQILFETLKLIAEEEGLPDYKIEILDIKGDGGNFASVAYNATISSTGREKLHLFGKVAAVSESIRQQMIHYDSSYAVERLFYTTTVPAYENLQEKYGIPLEDRYRFVKCYGSHSKFMEETLVLEDLVVDGYTVHNRLAPLDWDYISKAVTEIAKFHALSFAHKRDYPDVFRMNKENSVSIVKMYLDLRETVTLNAQSVQEVIPTELGDRLKTFMHKQLQDDTFRKYYEEGKWQVLVHSDYRSSNIMHKSKNGKVSSLIPVDYQTLHLGSPSTDLLYLIYTGTDETFRRAHLPQLLDLYYNTLSSWLRRMELDPDLLFSRRDFDQDYQDMLPYGLLMAVFILPIVLVDTDQGLTLDDEGSKLSDMKLTLKDNFVKRFLPIINEFIDQGVL